MGFSDFFKPRWRHTSPEIRLKAVGRLTENDQEIFKEIAMHDGDDRVRGAAIEKIADRDFLVTFVTEGKAADSVKKACVERACAVSESVPDDLFETMIKAIENEDILVEIALKMGEGRFSKGIMERLKDGRRVWRVASASSDPLLMSLAVSKISEPTLLVQIAQENCGQKAGAMIVEALSSHEHLAQVAEKASSRKVRKMAEAKIKRSVVVPEAPVSPPPEAGPDKALKAEIEKSESDRKQRETVQMLLEGILKEAQQGTQEKGDGLTSLIKEVRGRWEAVDMTPLSAESREAYLNRFESAVARLESFLAAHLAHLESIEKKKQEMVAAEREKEAQQAEDEEKALLLKLVATVETAIDQERFYEAEPAVKSAREEWRKAGERVPQFKKELSERFDSALTRFFDKLFDHRENRSWEKWANLNQKKELCVLLESLLAEGRLSGTANRVREAFQTWKSIGPVDRDESEPVWERFRVASDAIYERCAARKQEILKEIQAITSGDETGQSSDAVKKLQEAWNEIGSLPPAFDKEMKEAFRKCVDDYFTRIRKRFERREQERQENLEIKKALLERAKALEKEPYGKKAIDEVIDLQKKWKETGPIPKSMGDELWDEFRSVCNHFFERIDQEQNENLLAKEGLCQEAERVVAERGEGMIDDQIRIKLIGLQQQWKEIGPVPRAASDQVWKRFRDACDAFFNTYEEEAARRYGEKEKLVLQAEALSGSEDWKAHADALKILQQEWKALGAFQTAKDRDLWERFHQACDGFFTRKREVFKEKESRTQEILEKREALLTHAELLVRMMHPDMAFEHLQSIPMNEQLRLSLSYRDEVLVPDDEKSTHRNVMKKIAEIRSEWHKLDKGAGNADKELWNHFLLVEKALRQG